MSNDILDRWYKLSDGKWYVNALKSHGCCAGPFDTENEAFRWYERYVYPDEHRNTKSL